MYPPQYAPAWAPQPGQTQQALPLPQQQLYEQADASRTQAVVHAEVDDTARRIEAMDRMTQRLKDATNRLVEQTDRLKAQTDRAERGLRAHGMDVVPDENW